MLHPEYLAKQLPARCSRKAPVVVCCERAANGADYRHCRQEDAARPQYSVYMAQRSPRVVDKMQGLGEHEAVKRIGRNVVSRCQIGNDRGARVCGIDVEDITALHAPTKPSGIVAV